MPRNALADGRSGLRLFLPCFPRGHSRTCVFAASTFSGGLVAENHVHELAESTYWRTMNFFFAAVALDLDARRRLGEVADEIEVQVEDRARRSAAASPT